MSVDGKGLGVYVSGIKEVSELAMVLLLFSPSSCKRIGTALLQSSRNKFNFVF